jgi:hypothetical protein
MPLEDIGSYPPVMDEFSVHWEDANIATGGTPATDVKLEGAHTRTQFIALRNEIQAKITGAVALENGREIAATNRDTLKMAVRDRLAQFRGMVRAVLPKSKYASSTPVLPDLSAAESKFLAAFDDAADLWGRIDADVTMPGFTPPLVIAGYPRGTFVTDIAAVRTAYMTLATAENDLGLGQEERDVLLPVARERMVQYRAVIEAIFGPNHPLTLSLPQIYPQPGSTPAAVTLSGAWNAGVSAAAFNFTASAAANLLEYELRMSPGATYDSGTATVVGNAPPGTLTLQTAAGLAASGDVASFKVFVKLTTGNESGSNTVTITRP